MAIFHRTLLSASLALALFACKQADSQTAQAQAQPSDTSTALASRTAPGDNAVGQPFTVTDFARQEDGYSGTVRISPEGSNPRLSIDLSYRGRPTCSLQGTMTREGGAYKVSSPDGPDLILTPTGANAFTLRYADPAHQPYMSDYCATGGSIDGNYRALPSGTPAATAGKAMTASKYPSCTDVRRSVASGEDAYSVLEKHYPARLVDPATVDSVDISNGDMDHLMSFVACAVEAAQGDGAIIDPITALFDSKRHKVAAFAALDRVGKSNDGEAAAAARALAAQMRQYHSGPNG